MKKNYIILLLFIFITGIKANATVHIVQVSNFTFTPNNVNAVIGDTVRWIWVSGSHTTTCDGSTFTSLPAGAASWNSPINNTVTSFGYVVTVAGTYQYKCSPHAPNMAGTLTVSSASGIATLNNSVNYLEVNPPAFKSDAIIKFSLSENATIKISIYDFSGRKLETLVNKTFNKGEHTLVWDAARIPQGIYFCRLENEEYTLTRKFVRVK